MNRTIILILFITSFLFPQNDIDITRYLQQVSEGKSNLVYELLPELKKQYPDASSLIYLEGVLSEDGRYASELFSEITEKYPRSTYADAASYRLYSYYSAIDDFKNKEKYYQLLINNYPSSQYTSLLPGVVKEKTTNKEEFNYTVQAGAFANNTNAENLRRKFEKAGYFTFVKDKVVGGTVFKIVYAGRFRTRTEAESFQVILDRKYGLKGIITGLGE